MATAAKLHIAPGLELDPDYVGGGTFAVLAKRGAGKTYTGRVLAEELWRTKVPFVLLDPMGASWGLRASADGTGDGIPVPIFGGAHGDVPLERGAGAVLADLVVDERLSMIIDMKNLGSHAAEREFAHAFLDRLYRRNSDLLHLILDEADQFAPQRPPAGDQALLGITEDIVRRGRNSGLGITLITQRPAVLNKNVLTQLDGLVVMRITGYNDREAIDDWVKGHADKELAAQVKGTLAELANGESWWWIPELGILERVQVRRARTFDSSPTRTRHQTLRAPSSLADVDLHAIRNSMAATIERAGADDPAALRSRIAHLEQLLRERPPTRPREVEVQVPVPVLDPGLVDRLENQLRALHTVGEQLAAGARDIADRISGVGDELQRAVDTAAAPPHALSGPPALAPPPPARDPARRPERATSPPDPVEPADTVQLKAGARRILETLARHHPMCFTRSQIGTLTRFRITGGTFQTYWSTLKRAGLVTESGDECRITDAGLRRAGVEPQAPATTEELVDMWRNRLRAGARAMLDELVRAHPASLTREQLAAAVDMTASGGTFQTYLSDLRRNGLADVTPTTARASDTLFIAANPQ